MKDRFYSYWREKGISPFSPIQEEVFSKKELLDPQKNLVIIAPTSSGKSLIIEYFISYAFSSGKKAIYLTPFKSILEEKLKEFAFLVEFFNKKMMPSTHELFHMDSEILKGEYDLLLTVYEKMGYFLQKKRNFLSNVGLLVADEISVIEDKTRGPYIDILLSYARKKRIKILATTSFISSPKVFSEYLDARLLLSEKRPTPIRIGYVKDGIFYWREGKETEYKKERLIEKSFSPGEEFYSLLEKFWKEEGAIVFFSTRAKARRVLSYAIDRFPKLYDDIETKGLPKTLFSEKIKRYISCGIGYHSRDLTYPERRFIEDLVWRGKIRLLFATTTVALGVNLPFRNVVFPEFPSVSYGMLKNMLGRAARGKVYPYGRAIFFTKRDIREEEFSELSVVTFKDKFDEYTFLLRKIIFNVDERELYLTYNMKTQKDSAYLFLAGEGLLKEEKGKWVPTLLGILVASSGLDISSFLEVKGILCRASDLSLERLVYLFVGVKAISEFYIDSVSHREFFRWLPFIQEALPFVSGRNVTERELDRIRKTLIILDLIRGKELIEIERIYKISAGIIVEFFDRFTWVVEVASKMIDYIETSFNTIEALKELEYALSQKDDRRYVLCLSEKRPHEVFLYGEKINLTYKQFELLKLLAKEPGRVFTYDEIMSALWKDNYDVSLKQISYHKGELCRKLGKKLIKSVKGRGLYLDLLPSEVGIC